MLSKGIVVFVLAGGDAHRLLADRARLAALAAACTLRSACRCFSRIAAPWFILVSRRNPEFLQFFFVHEHFRASSRRRPSASSRGGTSSGRCSSWVHCPGWLSRAASARAALARPGINVAVQAAEIPAVIFACVTLVFFSMSGSKLATYILPIFPPLAAITGVAVAERRSFYARWHV